MSKKNINKVVLAYSGGLDTSVILAWIKDTYDCEIVTFTADLGQGDELSEAEQKAILKGGFTINYTKFDWSVNQSVD